MSAELIVFIVGVVFVLVAVIDGLRAGEASGMVRSNLRIPLGIAGILMIIYGGYSYGTMNLPGNIEQVDTGNKTDITYPIETVQVISPVDQDSVKCRILTSGVYPENHGRDIWVLLKPSDNKYYPQSDHTNTSYKRNGEWQVITRFGGDEGEWFEVIVYETDSSASEFFSNTIADWKAQNAYAGLEYEELPEGAREVQRLQVRLAENCRGVF